MATPSTDEEQKELLRRWWNSQGKFMVGGVAIGMLVIFGYQAWQNRITTRSETASLMYTNMMNELAIDPKSESALAQGEAIVDDYDDTPYATLTTLALAKRAYLADNKEAAETSLRWAIKNTADDGLRHIARIRLARLLMEQNRLEDVDTLISGVKFGSFEAGYQEIIGDVHRLRNNISEAQAAYSTTLALLPPEANELRQFVELKLNNLGTAE